MNKNCYCYRCKKEDCELWSEIETRAKREGTAQDHERTAKIPRYRGWLLQFDNGSQKG